MALAAVNPNDVKTYEFEDIADKINDRNRSKVDVRTTLADIKIEGEHCIDGKTGRAFQFNDRSLSQLSGILGKGITTSYWKRFPSVGPVNWPDQVTYLKDRVVESEGNRDIVLRGLTDPLGDLRLRAIVSGAYACIDDGDILPVLERAFKDTTIYNYRVTQDFTFIEGFIGDVFTLGNKEDEDWHYYAQCYSNSEVGGGPLKFYSGIFRMWCDNLCRDILGYGSYSRRHIARNRNMMDISEEVADNIRYASFRIREQRDEVVYALERTKSHLYSDSLAAARELKKVVKSGGFAEPVVKACSEAWGAEPGNSAFHVLQAMTAGAKTVKGSWSYADRCKLEEHAGKFVASFN